MAVKTITDVEQEIDSLRKGIDACMNRAMTYADQCDPAEKAAFFGTMKKELDEYRSQLEIVTVTLDSLQKKILDAEVLCSEAGAFLEKNLPQGLSAEDEDFSASSISPLA